MTVRRPLVNVSGTIKELPDNDDLSVNGNLTISGASRRILSDFSGIASTNTLFQSSGANSNTYYGMLPSGTGNTSGMVAFNTSDPANASYLTVGALATYVYFMSTKIGTGTNLPMRWYTGSLGGQSMDLDTSGNLKVYAGWMKAPSFATGYTTTATAAGTTTLTVTSNGLQYFTGTSTQTVVMPVTSTLTDGQAWKIVNKSTGAVTVNSSGGNLILTVAAGAKAIIECILTSGTTAASWEPSYFAERAGSSSQAFAASDLTCTSLNGGQLAGFRNKFINGGCAVRQRSTVAISGAYQFGSVDRMLVAAGGTPTAGTITSFANTTTSSGTSVAVTGYSSSGTGTAPAFAQRIEQKNCYDLRSKTVTISAWVYHTQGTTLTYAISLAKFGSLDVYSGASSLGSATMSVSSVPTSTWTRIIGAFTFGANDCDNGIAVVATASGNATYTTATVALGDYQLEVGSNVTPFENRPYSVEEQLCRWYGQPLHSSGFVSIGQKYATAYIDSVIYFQAMRTPPTLTNPSSTTVTWNAGAAGANQASAYDPVAAGYTTITGALTVSLNTSCVNSAVLRMQAGTSFSGGVTSVIVGLGATNPYFLSAEL